jgi:hypothetical protein
MDLCMLLGLSPFMLSFAIDNANADGFGRGVKCGISLWVCQHQPFGKEMCCAIGNFLRACGNRSKTFWEAGTCVQHLCSCASLCRLCQMHAVCFVQGEHDLLTR